jgi:hypothetical protein
LSASNTKVEYTKDYLMTSKKIIDKCIKDKNGKIVLGQFPNAPLFGWLGFKLIGYLPLSTALLNGSRFISTAFLFNWAYLEITSGATYLRRAFGAAVMLMLVISATR